MQEIIRVGLFSDPPYSCAWRNCSDNTAGLYAEFVYLFCETANVTCRYDISPDEDFGYVDANGTWFGMIKHIKDDLFDLTFPYFWPTDQRLEVVDFSIPLAYESTIFVTRRAQLSTRLSPLVFHWSVWLLLILVSMFIGFLIAISDKLKMDTFCFKFLTNFIDTFSFVSDQTSHVSYPKLGIRFVITFWGLAVLILSGTYGGRLTASLLHNIVAKPLFTDFLSFVECVETRNCRVVVPKDFYVFLDKVQTSKNEIYSRLRNALLYNPAIRVVSYEDAFEIILNDDIPYSVAVMGQIAFKIKTHSNMNCSYDYIEYEAPGDAFPLRKNSNFKEKLNNFVANVVQTGLFNNRYSKLLGVEHPCQSINVDKDSVKTNIHQFFGCLFVLLIGIISGMTVLLFEIFNSKWFKKGSLAVN